MNPLEEAMVRANENPENATESVYWVHTMRGWQPRCRACDGSLTRGPQGGCSDTKCRACGAEVEA